MNTNRNYKDSVFTKLFGEKENLLELYNAIENTDYGKDTEIQIATLENVLYMEQINDISFVIGDKIIVLIEHQSTINKNMPLRMFIYLAKIYEKMTDGKKGIYGTSRIEIPAPEFIVLYNGKDEYPDKETIFLSGSYKEKGKKKFLELEVQVYNINKGRNPEIAAKSKTLSGYETFIAEIRENEKTMSREEAINKAVKDCIRRNILKSFLEKHSTEVVSMLTREWNWDDALRVREEQGMRKNAEITARNMKAEGLDLHLIARITGLTFDEVLNV